AAEALRPHLRWYAESRPRPGVPRGLRAGAGRTDVSAEATRRSADARRPPHGAWRIAADTGRSSRGRAVAAADCRRRGVGAALRLVSADRADGIPRPRSLVLCAGPDARGHRIGAGS